MNRALGAASRLTLPGHDRVEGIDGRADQALYKSQPAGRNRVIAAAAG